jgi:hypothetical protein
LAPLRGAILLRAARAKYLFQYRKVANFSTPAMRDPIRLFLAAAPRSDA